jgi:hypothetical protein
MKFPLKHHFTDKGWNPRLNPHVRVRPHESENKICKKIFPTEDEENGLLMILHNQELSSLHPEDVSSKVLRNVGILPERYMTSQLTAMETKIGSRIV